MSHYAPIGTEQLPLFDPPRLVRTSDPVPSHEAATAIAEHLSDLQRRVLDAYRVHGPMSAREAERLPEFEALGFATVRKRVSELARSGHLVGCGTERDSGRTPSTVYAVVAP